jgi:ribosomal protein S19E (S16A)
MELNKHETEVLRHTLGYDYGKGGFRNHFSAGKGHLDMPALESLEQKGLMYKRPDPFEKEDFVYHATEAGKIEAVKTSVIEPKLSKAKQRYKRYLEFGDMFDSFLAFLKWDTAQLRANQ